MSILCIAFTCVLICIGLALAKIGSQSNNATPHEETAYLTAEERARVQDQLNANATKALGLVKNKSLKKTNQKQKYDK